MLRGQASADAPPAPSLGHLFLLLCVSGFLIFLGHLYLNSQEQHLGNNAGSRPREESAELDQRTSGCNSNAPVSTALCVRHGANGEKGDSCTVPGRGYSSIGRVLA